MTLDSLLEDWARWCALRDDHGLGYACGGLNRIMAGDVCTGVSPFSLPYGVDADSVFTVMDTAICKLTPRRREIIMVEYRCCGTQAAKAAGLKRPVSLDTYKRLLRNARWNLAGDVSVKRLLKNH